MGTEARRADWVPGLGIGIEPQGQGSPQSVASSAHKPTETAGQGKA